MNSASNLPVSIEEQLRQFVGERMLFTDAAFDYPDDASFLNEGIVDSLGVMELVAFVQNTYGLSVERHEITLDNFDSIVKLSAFIRSKIGEGN